MIESDIYIAKLHRKNKTLIIYFKSGIPHEVHDILDVEIIEEENWPDKNLTPNG